MTHRRCVINAGVKRFVPVSDEVVTASEYLEIVSSRPASIKESRFVPPRIGEKGYGTFKITYNSPVLKETG